MPSRGQVTDLLGGDAGDGERAGAESRRASRTRRRAASSGRGPPSRPRRAGCDRLVRDQPPSPMTTSWSAVSCISLIRWLETKTVRPSAARPRSRLPDPAHAVRVEAVDRLVEHQHLRVAQQRAGDAEPLAHAERVGAGAAPGGPGQPDAFEHLVDPAARGCRCCAPWPRRWSRPLRPGWTAWRRAARRPSRSGWPQLRVRAPADQRRSPRRRGPGRGSSAWWWTCRRRSGRGTR